MLLAGFATAAVPMLIQGVEARPLPVTTGAAIAGETPVTQIRSRRNAAIAGAVALGAIGAIAAARSQPYGYGPSYGHTPSYGYEPAYGYGPVVSGYDHGYARGYNTGYASVVSGYDYAHGYGNGGYYDLPGGYGYVSAPVVVQRGVRYAPSRHHHARRGYGYEYETGFNR
jgi:hypothetical protein